VAVSNPRKNIEFYCLGILLRKPELIYRLDRKLEEYGLSPLSVEDFEYTDHQMLFNVLRQAMGQDEKDHGQYVISQMPEALSALTNDLLTQTEKLDPLDDRLLEDILGRFLDLRRTHAMTNVNQLRFMQEDEQRKSKDVSRASHSVHPPAARVGSGKTKVIETTGVIQRCRRHER
jgi:hypothetical protein